AYRSAVARIILNIQSESHKTYVEIAEDIDVSVGTISNAANKKADLNAVYLQRLQRRYGAHTLDPLLALNGCRAVPIEAADDDELLPDILLAAHKLSVAMSPKSPGGIRVIHSELLDAEQVIAKAMRGLSGLLVRANSIRM